MKKFLLLAGVACLLSANAQAGVSQYVSGKLSYDFNKVKAKFGGNGYDEVLHMKLNKVLVGSTHVAYGVRAGYVRGEVELNNSRDIKRNWVEEGDYLFDHFRLYKHSFMANAYFDYLTCTPWTPYVGAGLGVSYLKADFGEIAKSTYNLAWQVMGGITYDINSHWTLDLGYRYADLGRVRKAVSYGDDFREVAKVDARDHEIMFGARYEF
ncbi:MAG: porin family protein [Alphaproteobacteria bacterium]|nr:porin family protein [Alphaproteobacteria bacterium]